MALVAEDLKKKFLIKNTDFFLKNFKPVSQDIEASRIKQIVDVELECLGYGVFKPKDLLQNFFNYTIDLLRMFGSKSYIKSLKIILNGFQLDPKFPFIRKLCEEIPKIKDNLNVLWIHTANLKNTSNEDFNDLLKLLNKLSNVNFQDYSLQCANWKFTPSQPSFKALKKIFDEFANSMEFQKIQNKHFRLEMSGWYYNLADAKAFLGFRCNEAQLKKVPAQLKDIYSEGSQFQQESFAKQLQKFVVSMQQLMKQLVKIMENITQFELDMRNTHQILKFKNLKKRLDNITKQNTFQMSIMSKRIEIPQEEGEKQFKLNIVM